MNVKGLPRAERRILAKSEQGLINPEEEQESLIVRSMKYGGENNKQDFFVSGSGAILTQP